MEQRVRRLVERGEGQGNDGSRRCAGDKVVGGGVETCDLKGGALVLTNDGVVGCMDRQEKQNSIRYQVTTF